MTVSPRILLAAGLALGSAPHAAQALDLDDVVQVDVLPGWRTASDTHLAGLRIRLAEGWKTYWRSPGDGGIPPQLDLSRSENVAGVKTHWPKPEVFNLNGMRSIGYADEVVFPIEITPDDRKAPISLTGRLDLGVCEEVCMPVSVELSAVLSTAGQPGGAIAEALGQLPQDLRAEVRCEIWPIEDGLRLTAHIPVSAQAGEVAVIELSDPVIWISEAVQRREDGVLVAEVDMVPPDGRPFALDRADVRVTVISDRVVQEVQGCVAAG